MPLLGGIGIEIWTTTKNIFFDNIILTSNEEVAREFADNVLYYYIIQTYENKRDDEYVSQLQEFVNKRKEDRDEEPTGYQLYIEKFLDFAILHPFIATIVPTCIMGFVEFLLENVFCRCCCKRNV